VFRRCVRHRVEDVREAGLKGLAELGPLAAEAVPDLTAALPHAEAVVALGRIGPDARPAVKDLRALLGDDRSGLSAAVALARIDPTDATAVPVLRKALESGVHVIGYDANSEPDAREWFVNQAEFNGIAKALVDSLADQMGADASFGIVTSTFTTPNQARWIAEMWAYASDCYPDLNWLETLEAQEDAVLSFQQAQTLINKYGEDLDGIFAMTSVATELLKPIMSLPGE